ncbi:MAG: insulinase family protein [Deltaproteobacteria bacterium]|nr:insulinase family protein [Deltaproteobacteria bacterium]
MSLDEKSAEIVAKDAAKASGHAVHFAGLAALSGGLKAARFKLDNGLTLLTLPDSQAPIFAFQTWFSVGSRHEPKGKTGIAHLFEHLMFKGTKTHPLGEFDHEMEKRGAQTNAATWVDWTYYRESLPALGDNFETVLGYESDRMVNLALTQEMVDSEREVVKNERRLRVDDSIHGSLDELMYQTAFIAHSYGHPTIGYMDDLNAMTLKEFEAFYRSYYAPNNANVVIVGDLDPVRMVAGVAKAYGAIQRQPVPPPPTAVEPPQKDIRRAAIKKPTDTERASIVFHGPPQSHEDHAALQVAAEILCGGETGRIYSELVIDKELCQEAHASLTPYKEPGLFQIDIGMKPGLEHAQAEAIVVAHLQKLAKEGPAAKEVEKTKNRIEAAFLRVLLDADGKAEQIGHFETTAGDASFLSTVLERLRKVDEGAVQKAAEKYLNPNARTVACALPENEERQA